MVIESLIGLIGAGLVLGLIAAQTAKTLEDKRKKIPIMIKKRRINSFNNLSPAIAGLFFVLFTRCVAPNPLL
jgi:hypothetical protein